MVGTVASQFRFVHQRLEDLGRHNDKVLGGDTGAAVDDDLQIPELPLHGVRHGARMMCEE